VTAGLKNCVPSNVSTPDTPGLDNPHTNPFFYDIAYILYRPLDAHLSHPALWPHR